ncbi:hypothetical protein AWZ03_014180 [Drosophila navojoa]|uniref:Uncharacterized protein n=1 Tax=Drosophila navojoa TaxID=7232 RepID=A0A484AS33_DRONA|nr:hypothetical protein AWZ03_014180 [Drosophila navojoa]
MFQPPIQDTDANEKRVYQGKPENKKDPNAVAKPARSHPNQNQPRRSAPAKPEQRPTPANKDAPKSEPRTGDPFSDSIFGKGLSIRESVIRQSWAAAFFPDPTAAAAFQQDLRCPNRGHLGPLSLAFILRGAWLQDEEFEQWIRKGITDPTPVLN